MCSTLNAECTVRVIGHDACCSMIKKMNCYHTSQLLQLFYLFSACMGAHSIKDTTSMMQLKILKRHLRELIIASVLLLLLSTVLSNH